MRIVDMAAAMKYLQREIRCRKLFIAVTALAILVIAALADAVSNRVLLPRYFQYSLAHGEHLKKLNQQGKAKIHVVDAAGNEREVGELEARTKARYSIAYALLDASFVILTVIALFLAWPRVPILNEHSTHNAA